VGFPPSLVEQRSGEKTVSPPGSCAFLLQHPGGPRRGSGDFRAASYKAPTVRLPSPGGLDGAVRPRVICSDPLTLEAELGQNLRQEPIKR